MNGYDDDYDDSAYDYPEDEDSFPGLLEDDGEFDLERRGRRGRRAPAPKGARGSGYSQPRPSSQYVTQTQFQAATTRIGTDIKKLNEADKTLNNRINANNARLDRHAAAIRKENEMRKKADADLRNTLLLLAIVPLILRPKTRTINAATAGLAAGDKVVVEENDFLKTLIPIGLTLLGPQLSGVLGGLGGTGYGASAGASTGSIL